MPSQPASRPSASASPILPLCSRTNPAILTIAHRGAWANAPENSLASIRDAIALGVEIVEIDTQATADGRLVVIHDVTLDRTTTQSGTVSSLEFATVRRARLRQGAGGDTAGLSDETVPTLEDVLEEARGRIAVNIDTKFAHDFPLVIEAVRRLGMQDEVIVKTDIDPAAGHFPVLDTDWFGTIPHMPMFTIRPGRFAEDLRMIEPLRAPMVEVRFSDIADISAARAELERQNIRVWINTLDVSHCLDFDDSRALTDPEAVWGVLAEAGVGAIQTDAVAALKAWAGNRRSTGAAR